MIIGIDARPLQSSPRTGVGEFTYELLSHLFALQKDHQFILFSNAWRVDDMQLFVEYPNVSWVRSRIPNKLLHACIALFGLPKLDTFVARRAGVKQLDVWYSPNLHFTALTRDVKHVLTIHDLSFVHDPSFFSKKGRLWHNGVHPKQQIARATQIIVPSTSTARDVADVYEIDRKKIATVSPGICSHITSKDRATVAEVQATYDLPDTFLLYLGTIEKRKNINGLLEAYANSSYLKKHMPLVCAGALGYGGKVLKQTIEQTPGARYIGYIDEREKHALYSLAHAFVYPSLYEGFGLPVLEAIACGTPVVTSHRSSLPEVVGEAGVLVHPYNIHEVQVSLERMVHDKEFHQRLVDACQVQATTFSWQESANNFLCICESV